MESTPNEIEITNSSAYGIFQNYYSVTGRRLNDVQLFVSVVI